MHNCLLFQAEEKARIERECEKHQRLKQQLQEAEEKKLKKKVKAKEKKDGPAHVNTDQLEDPKAKNGKKKKTKHKDSTKSNTDSKETVVHSPGKVVSEILDLSVRPKKSKDSPLTDIKKYKTKHKMESSPAVERFTVVKETQRASKLLCPASQPEPISHSKTATQLKEALTPINNNETQDKPKRPKQDNRQLFKTGYSNCAVPNKPLNFTEPNPQKNHASQPQKPNIPLPSAKESHNLPQSKKKEANNQLPTVMNGQIKRNEKPLAQPTSSDTTIPMKKSRKHDEPVLTNGKHVINNTNQSSHPSKNPLNILTRSQNGVTLPLQNNIPGKILASPNKIDSSPSGTRKVQSRGKAKSEETSPQDQVGYIYR